MKPVESMRKATWSSNHFNEERQKIKPLVMTLVASAGRQKYQYNGERKQQQGHETGARQNKHL